MPERLARLPSRRLPGGFVMAVARSRRSRALGLAGLTTLPSHVGLLLPRCRSVHTLGMRFPLDLLWLGPGEALVRVDRCVAPHRARSCRAARSVLEVRAGCGDPFADAMLAA
jgi:uncharacterized membrane protein (UPF0127 family)